MKFPARVEQGKIIIITKGRFDKFIKPFEGKNVVVSINKQTSPRSLNQNKYYWKVVVKILADEFGYMSHEMHEILKYRFLRRENIDFEGMQIPIVGSTTKLNTVEMEEFLRGVRQWALQEHNINIPLPNEYY